MRKSMVVVAGLWSLLAVAIVQAAQPDVFNMGGARDPVTGVWTGLASLEFVQVANPGNPNDDTGFGAVDYTYNIGKYEITAGQYTAFLNAVAATDTYWLYTTSMWSDSYGCKIQRSGSSGSYTYSVASERANRPVNYVSFGSAMRFANWLQNGQPTGPQGLSTTEDGAYYVNGATGFEALSAVTRKTGWQWAVTSENEWYKAAYYDPNKPGGPGYWDYPTGTDSIPSKALSSTGTNNANFRYTIGSPYYRTPVGAFAASDSPYGTFDQGGNVSEWNEAIIYDFYRGVRGGNYFLYAENLGASGAGRGYDTPASPYDGLGFRVVELPEPATLSLLALGGAAAILRRRRRSSRRRVLGSR